MKRILLCELNVSEGRNKEALDKITAALESSPDIKVIEGITTNSWIKKERTSDCIISMQRKA